MEYFNNYKDYTLYDKLYNVLNYNAFVEFINPSIDNILNHRVNISDRLAHFLKVKKGTRLPRSEINRAIVSYIRSDMPDNISTVLNLNKNFWIRKLNTVNRNLQHPKRKSYTILDSSLSHLFSTDETEITYAQIHHYLAKHITR